MLDQLIIGEHKSQDDFEASVSERTISSPKKKEIKETIPYSNVTYDFSAINGEIYWEERELIYTMEMIAESLEELEEKKIALRNWIMNVQEETLVDPFIKGWHFKVTYKEISFNDEVEKTTVKASFTAYPYMIADEATQYTDRILANTQKEIMINNNSAHKITPIIITENEITISFNEKSYAIPPGTTEDHTLKFPVGTTSLTVFATEDSELTILFYCEVL